jgi:hypothetical protein
MTIIAGQEFLKFDEIHTADLQSMQDAFSKAPSVGSDDDAIQRMVSNQVNSLNPNANENK